MSTSVFLTSHFGSPSREFDVAAFHELLDYRANGSSAAVDEWIGMAKDRSRKRAPRRYGSANVREANPNHSGLYPRLSLERLIALGIILRWFSN